MQSMCNISEQAVFDTLKYRIVVNEYGTRMYYNSANKLHRDDGPAAESSDGDKFWYQNGLIHRTDGPASVSPGGTKEWYQTGLRHRTDGPAIEWASGRKDWFINGTYMTEAEFNQAVKQND